MQDQAPPEAGGGSGEGGGLSHWQRTGLLKTWRLVHVSILHCTADSSSTLYAWLSVRILVSGVYIHVGSLTLYIIGG